MAENNIEYVEDKRNVVYTELEKDLFDNYILERVKEELSLKKEDFTISNTRRLDWYKLMGEVLPGLIFCSVKNKNDSEMSLFAMDNPSLQAYGLKYTGNKNIDLFWNSLKDALTFNSEDFFICVYKETTTKKGRVSKDPVRFEKDSDGDVITVLRDGSKGKTCLLVEENYDTYDKIIAPDSLLGECLRAKMVGNFREWTIKMIEKFGF